MLKIKIDAAPTFEAPVDIPVHGGDAVPVKFTFRHRTKSATKEWLEQIKEARDADIVLDMATAWEFDDAFTHENIERLLESYAGAGSAIIDTYLRELSQARTKN